MKKIGVGAGFKPAHKKGNDMHYDPEKHHRRSIRLPGFNYAADGAYFVTICIKDRKQILGKIDEGQFHLSECGRIVKRTWLNLPQHYDNLSLDEWVIMPNHVHGILFLRSPAHADDASFGANVKPASPLSEIVRVLKRFRRARSTLSGKPRAPLSGNEIILNASSVTTKN